MQAEKLIWSRMTSLLAVFILVAIAFALLSIRVLLKKNGRFRSIHIGDSKAMRQRGIGCAKSQDNQARRSSPNKIDVKNL